MEADSGRWVQHRFEDLRGVSTLSLRCIRTIPQDLLYGQDAATASALCPATAVGWAGADWRRWREALQLHGRRWRCDPRLIASGGRR